MSLEEKMIAAVKTYLAAFAFTMDSEPGYAVKAMTMQKFPQGNGRNTPALSEGRPAKWVRGGLVE